jgi:hypothetical protein
LADQKDARGVDRQEQDTLKAEGPASGNSLKELGQPVHSQNAEEVMAAHFDHPKWHKH